jgi:hypothetical protein
MAASTLTKQLLSVEQQARQAIAKAKQVGPGVVCAIIMCASWYRTGSKLAALGVGLVCWLLFRFAGFAWWARQRRISLVAADAPIPPIKQLWKTYQLERKRLQYLAKQWPTACITQGLTASKKVPQLNSVKPTLASDITATLTSGRMGVPVTAVQAKADLIREVVGCQEVVVAPTASGCADITFNWSDPMGRTLHLPDLPVAKAGTVAYGVRRDGTPATIEQDKSVLIGGMTGFGKSNIIWTMLADLIRQGVPIRLYVSDPKGGIELTALGRHVGQQMGNVQVMKYATTAAATVEMVDDVEKRMRFSQSKQQGRKHKPTKENPLCIVLLDELLPLHEMIRQKNKGALAKILYEGRASGYVVWANAQIGHADVLDTLRNYIPQRVCVKTKTPQTTDTFLGTGAETRGALCSLIDPKDKGVGFADSESAIRPEKFRAPLVKDTDIDRIAVGAIPEGMQTKPEVRRCAVYRAYSYDLPDGTPRNRLEYIGKAVQPGGNGGRFEGHRLKDWGWCPEHEREENWWVVHVDESKMQVEWFDSEPEAIAAEEKAIDTEMPYWNYVHNKRNPFAIWRKRPKGLPTKPLKSRSPVSPMDGPELVSAGEVWGSE